MKKCTKCKQNKKLNLENFSPNTKIDDGLSSWCRICKRKVDKIGKKKYRENHIGFKAKEYKKYCTKNPEKVKAQQTLNKAVKKGIIERSPCVNCGSTHRVHGHHPDYSFPLKVIWVCSIHHKKYH